MWYLLNSVKGANVIERVDGGGESTVKAEDLVINEGSEGKVIEEVGEVLPDVGISIFSEALVIKAIDLSDLTGFMISTENGDSAWVSDFERDKEGYSFD